MKAVCYILTLRIFGLATSPCNDDTSCAGDSYVDSTVGNSESDDAANDIDLCSPFCSCSCCSPSVQLPSYLVYRILEEAESADQASIYSSNFTALLSSSIWQP